MLVGRHAPADHQAIEIGDGFVGAAQLDGSFYSVFEVSYGHVLFIHTPPPVKVSERVG